MATTIDDNRKHDPEEFRVVAVAVQAKARLHETSVYAPQRGVR